MISAPGEPPGSRVNCTDRPRASNRSASIAACVDLPVPSPPSKVMNFPRIVGLFIRYNTITCTYLCAKHMNRTRPTRLQQTRLQYRRLALSPHPTALAARGLQLGNTGAQQTDDEFGRAIHRALGHASLPHIVGGLQRHVEREIVAAPYFQFGDGLTLADRSRHWT